MKIAMIDPSLFTLPYDLALSKALRLRGADVTLYGRGLRPMEAAPAGSTPIASFYKWSEALKSRVPNALFHGLKGLEHGVDMVRLVHALRAAGAHVVHFQWLPLPSIDMMAVRRIRRLVGPVVLTVHDTTPFNDSPTSALQRVGAMRVWQAFDRLIVHSEASRTLLTGRGLPTERIAVIPHGILDISPARPALTRADATLTIVLFGRIKAYKGVDVMIEALGRLSAQSRSRCRVLVVGEPLIPVEPLRTRAEALGVSEMIDWDLRYVSDADMGEIFGRADIFAFPYREIDTSGVLMSCLPYGKPIIASEIGAFQKLLLDGAHGRTVPPDDPDALAEAIASLVANPAMLETCGRNVMLLSGRIPTWDKIAEETMELYENTRGVRRRAGRLSYGYSTGVKSPG
jgi:glycosyltransferase involved in cell wall biosynthesis